MQPRHGVCNRRVTTVRFRAGTWQRRFFSLLSRASPCCDRPKTGRHHRRRPSCRCRRDDIAATTRRSARYGCERHSSGRRRGRRQAIHPHHRGSVERCAARPRHVFGGCDPLEDRRRGAGGARRLPPHDRRLRRQHDVGRWPPAPSARRETATCSSTGSRGAPGSPSRSSTKPRRAVWSILAVRRRSARSAALRGAWTLLAEVGGGSTSLTLLRRGSPTAPASTRWARCGCASSSTCGG